MFDIFKRPQRGNVLWVGTAKDEEEVSNTVRKLHAVNPGTYFAFDERTQTKHIFKAEELDGNRAASK
jgi:hypothetical protein